MNLVYKSTCLVMFEDYEKDLFYIINIIDIHGFHNGKMITINTMWYGLTNEDVEHAIKEILNSGDYDIEHEIDLYRKSNLYKDLINNED